MSSQQPKSIYINSDSIGDNNIGKVDCPIPNLMNEKKFTQRGCHSWKAGVLFKRVGMRQTRGFRVHPKTGKWVSPKDNPLIIHNKTGAKNGGDVMPKYRKYVEMDIRDFRAAILKDKLSKETTLNIASLRRQASNRAAAKNSRKRKMGEEVTRRRIKITPPPFQSTSQLDALMMASGVLALVGMGKN